MISRQEPRMTTQHKHNEATINDGVILRRFSAEGSRVDYVHTLALMTEAAKKAKLSC